MPDPSSENTEQNTEILWWAVKFRASELVATLALENGAAGIEQLAGELNIAHLKCDEHALQRFISKMQALGASELEATQTEHKNWLAQCPELFEPVKAGELTLTPFQDLASANAAPDSPNSLKLIPGLGFGTGHHESTRLALGLLQTLSPNPPKAVFDFGCGNGVLGLAANMLYASDVLGVDIEADAIANARDNLSINPSLKMRFEVGSILPTHGQFDLILANIFAEVLAQHEPQLKSHLLSGGYLIMAGITSYSESQIESSFTTPDWKVLKRVEENSWIGLLLQKAL